MIVETDIMNLIIIILSFIVIRVPCPLRYIIPVSHVTKVLSAVAVSTKSDSNTFIENEY